MMIESSSDEENEIETLDALGGKYFCKRKKKVEKISEGRCWFPPVAIRLVYETCAIVSSRGGEFKIGPCTVSIPKEALLTPYEFKFMLLYGKARFKSPEERVVTPTLDCMPAHSFLESVTVTLPAFHDHDRSFTVNMQRSYHGIKWEHFMKLKIHPENDYIRFTTKDLCLIRAVKQNEQHSSIECKANKKQKIKKIESNELNALGGKYFNKAKELEKISEARWWSPPVAIRLVYETCAIVGEKGDEIRVGPCTITIPRGALRKTYEFKFMLLYGRERVKDHGHVVTPTLDCFPAHEFEKPVTILLPTCYVRETLVSFTPQRSRYGRVWENLKSEDCRPGIPFITFEVKSLSLFRAVIASAKIFHVCKKRMIFLCYRHPGDERAKPHFTWELRDDVIHSDKMLLQRAGYQITFDVEAKGTLKVKLESPNNIIKPITKSVKANDIFEQGFFLRENFYLLEHVKRSQIENFSYKILWNKKLACSEKLSFSANSTDNDSRSSSTPILEPSDG
ncbi:uncharacterized protein LOC143452194 [Clavelina lepadiformis]|uniref:uncharacterized protein LOC143452194 n=1 Tax=Clavelina lepadiformis TaxID=159417 RepID=UPI004041B8AE